MKKVLCLTMAIAALSICCLTACKQSIADKQAYKEFNESKGEAALVKKDERSQQLYPAFVMKGTKKKWGYIGEDGKFVIEPSFDDALDFQEPGLARVRMDQKFGLIDKTGRLIVECEYADIREYGNGAVIASENWSNYCLLNASGSKIFETDGQIMEFSCGLAPFSKKASKDKFLWGYVDKEGKVIVEPIYEDVQKFDNDRAIVKIAEGHYALIDKNGKVLRELFFDILWGLSGDIITFGRKTEKGEMKYGYISTEGSILIDARFSEAREFRDELAVVNAAENFEAGYGIIDKTGKFVIPPKYNLIEYLGEGLFAVPKKSQFTFSTSYSPKALFDSKGNQLTDFIYYDLNLINKDVVCVTDDKFTYVIDRNGKQIPAYPKIEGSGSFKTAGKLLKAEIDDDLFYYLLDSKAVWECDNSIRFDDGITVRSRWFRPDRCMKIRYPELSGVSDARVQASVNEALKKKFIGESKASNKADGEYTEATDIRFTADKNKALLNISKSGYFYPIGAAHGTPFKEEYHINTKNGKFYTLKDLFKENSHYKQRLTHIIKEKIDKAKKEGSEEIYFNDFTDLSSENCFTLSKDSLIIYFNPYEIAPYAAGFPQFEIPYAEIMDIIDQEGEFWKSFNEANYEGV